jgi:hypothetical protein
MDIRTRREERVRRQRRLEASSLFFRFLYAGVDGIALSHDASHDGQRKEYADKSLTYGEISYASFVQILDFCMHSLSISSSIGLVFVDLGCGTGKAVVTAALSNHNFRKVWGIEIAEALAACASRITENLTDLLKSSSDTKLSGSGDDRKVKGIKKKVKDVVESPKESDVCATIFKLVQHSDSANNGVPTDFIANKVCEKYGHKAFKAFIKKSGSFLKFLSQYPDHFDISDKNVLKILNSSFDAATFIDEIGEPHAVESSDTDLNFSITQHLHLYYNLTEIVVNHGDIYMIPWWLEADVVYVASLLFSDDMLLSLSLLFLQMKPHSIVITLRPSPILSDSRYPDRHLKLLSESYYKMSWQMAMVYIYRIDPSAHE